MSLGRASGPVLVGVVTVFVAIRVAAEVVAIQTTALQGVETEILCGGCGFVPLSPLAGLALVAVVELAIWAMSSRS